MNYTFVVLNNFYCRVIQYDPIIDYSFTFRRQNIIKVLMPILQKYQMGPLLLYIVLRECITTTPTYVIYETVLEYFDGRNTVQVNALVYIMRYGCRFSVNSIILWQKKRKGRKLHVVVLIYVQ